MFFEKISMLIGFALLMAVAVGCKQSILFNPDFWPGDSRVEGIISERGELIKCSDIRFNDYASMHKEKIKELKRLLMTSYGVGGKNRALVLKEYNKLLLRSNFAEPLEGL